MKDTLSMYIYQRFTHQNKTDYCYLMDKNYLHSISIAKKGHAYEELPAYENKYTFLFDNKPKGFTWTEDDNFVIRKFTIKEVNAVKIVNNITYRNVIEVTEEKMIPTNETLKALSTTDHFYARNVGKIYSLETFFPDYNQNVHTVEFKLLKHTKS